VTALARVFRTEPLELALLDGVNAPTEDAALRAQTIVCSGSLTADAHLILPHRDGVAWTIVNATVGGFSVIVRGPTGGSATVPHPAACNVVTDGTNFRLVGAAGSSGGGYTVTTNSFTMPAVSSSVTIPVANSDWMAVGQVVFVSGAGYFRVASKASSVSASLTNLGWTGNASPGATITTAKLVSSGGEIGATGPAGPAGAGATPVIVPCTGTISLSPQRKQVVVVVSPAADTIITLPDLSDPLTEDGDEVQVVLSFTSTDKHIGIVGFDEDLVDDANAVQYQHLRDWTNCSVTYRNFDGSWLSVATHSKESQKVYWYTGDLTNTPPSPRLGKRTRVILADTEVGDFSVLLPRENIDGRPVYDGDEITFIYKYQDDDFSCRIHDGEDGGIMYDGAGSDSWLLHPGEAITLVYDQVTDKYHPC
jgi:hypothetical protein